MASARFCQFLTPPLSALRIEPTPGRLASAIRIHKGKISSMSLMHCGALESGHLRATSSNNIHAIISCLGGGLHSKVPNAGQTVDDGMNVITRGCSHSKPRLRMQAAGHHPNS